MKKYLAVLLSLVMVLGLFACNGGSSGGSASGDGQDIELVVATSGDAITLDPTLSNDNQSSNAMLQIYEGLFRINAADGKLVNVLAESYDHPDDLTYIFHIRKGVKFHNGDELKASDVAWSLDRASKSPNVQHLFNMIESFKATDDYTVEMKMKQAFAGILEALAHGGAAICSEKAVKEGGDSYPQNPIGTGPFKFVSWSKASSIEFERNDDYWGEKPAAKKVTFRIIPEANSRSIELESGNVDLAYDIQPVDMERISKGAETTLMESQDYGTTYLGFNCKKKPFDDPKVREAIALALDLDSIVQKVWMGTAQTAWNSMPETLNYSISKETAPRKRDLEKAKALLKEAGVENLKLSISTNERQQRIDMATLMKGQLKEVGIDVEVKVLEWGAYNSVLKNGEQDLFMIAWIADTPDPDTFLFPCFHSSSQGEGGNYCFYSNPKLDELLEKARTESQSDERAKLYKEAQELIQKEMVWVPLCHTKLLVGANKKIQGFEMNPFGWYRLAPVTKK